MKTYEQLMTEFFYADCICAIVDLKLSNGDIYKIGVAITKDEEECFGDKKFEHESHSPIFQGYKDWYSMGKEHTVTRVSHKDFINILNLNPYVVGESVNCDHNAFIINNILN